MITFSSPSMKVFRNLKESEQSHPVLVSNVEYQCPHPIHRLSYVHRRSKATHYNTTMP